MRILFIRHGDPDYVNDTLTERGHKEAAALAKYISEWKIDDAYQSPLGRAQCTAKYSLDVLKKEAPTYDWLREFNARVDLNVHPEWLEAFPDAITNSDGTYNVDARICWDIVPAYLNKHPEYYEIPGWKSGEICTKTDAIDKYNHVCEEFDKILATYGYVRDGRGYRVEIESTKTIAFFCHFGVTCVIMSHLLNMSPFSLWHGVCLAPTSVTEIRSEEREQGYACFRAFRMGDVTHLMAENIEPSPAASFTEVYSDFSGRH